MISSTLTRERPTSQALGYIGWLALCFAASAGAVFVTTDGWYAGLNKPTWNPPASVFAPAWTVLYILMATAAWLVWRQGGWKAQRFPLGLFLVQWMLNALWTPLFFGFHLVSLAFAEIALLWVMIALTLLAFWRVKTSAGLLMLPYLLWVTFAAALNFSIWQMNR